MLLKLHVGWNVVQDMINAMQTIIVPVKVGMMMIARDLNAISVMTK
jgi:hypothetical protein